VRDASGSRIRIDRLRVRLGSMSAASAERIARDLGPSIVERLGPVVFAGGPLRATFRSLELPAVRTTSVEVPVVRDAVAAAVADGLASRLEGRGRTA